MNKMHNVRSFPGTAINLLVIASLALACLPLSPAAAGSGTPDPASVTLVGDLQSELGCGTDWDPACAVSHLTYDASDDVWQGTWGLPAGAYQYKVALNDSWNENYGANAAPNGANINLNLASPGTVKFYYDHKTNWITSSVNDVIVTAPGSYQSELGCPTDWMPDCLRSWLEDPSGSGVYSFSTTSIPPGSYEAKAAINESWNENYGQGGAPNGANIPFTVQMPGSTVTFKYTPSNHVLDISVKSPGPSPDNDIWWDGLRHDSRDTLYRTPGGAVPAGTSVTLRFRTYHNDVTGVQVRLYDLNAGAQRIENMSLAASDVSCYQPGLLYTCDFWAYTLSNAAPDNFWYRFIITDGTKKAYYADDTAALDGGLGSPSDSVVDNSYALMFYDPTFQAPAWAKNAVIYQIFPDRFRSGNPRNDLQTGAVRYDDPVLKLPWGVLPEGYCRGYSDAAATCTWRYGPPPPWGVGQPETPRGRDYYGGDLKGVDQELDYLKTLGVNTLYFNPIFDAGSNHGYDTQNYYRIDPAFGTQEDWDKLVRHADKLGIRILLDGVFNHMSSDSPFFDRYSHYASLGACESLNSPYRSWFTFHNVAAGSGPCAGASGPNSATYDGWFGFDTIPVLNKTLQQVQDYFINNTDSVAKHWLDAGASGWRLDVMGDPSFPTGYWEAFRSAVKTENPNALIIGELWQKDSTLLRFLRGDRADTTMNYRLRDAVMGLLSAGPYDGKGFGDSGRVLSVSEFANRLASIREDYPDATFYSLMNLLDSHDTARLLWVVTPGSNNRAEKEFNAANLTVGKQRQEIASLIQFTLPGAPTIYYGDEVGMTGNDDPDNRRTYPWLDKGGQPDFALYTHYQALARLRKANSALTSGDFRILFTNDASEIVAYGRKTAFQAALVVINRSSAVQTVSIPLAGYVPDGVRFSSLYGVANSGSLRLAVAGGQISLTLNPQSAWLLATAAKVDLLPTVAPTGLSVTNEGDGSLSLAWNSVPGAVAYNLYRSPVSGGGWIRVNSAPLTQMNFSDAGLRNTQLFYYVVTALDSAGNESAFSGETSGMPHLSIGWANLQWPPTVSHTISVVNRTANIYGQVWINGYTDQPGPTPGLRAQVGFGPLGSNPTGSAAWTWVEAGFNSNSGNNDEFVASFLPETTGSFDYVYRYSTTNGRDWLYADLNGPIASGAQPSNPGKLTVLSSGDTTPPAAPTNLLVSGSSPFAIDLAWDSVQGDASLYGYEVLRSPAPGEPFILLARLTGTSYSDANVTEGSTYRYVVRALDYSFNRSGFSNEVSATAQLRTVTITLNVTVPTSTDGTGKNVYIAGFLDRLDGGLPQWDPAGVSLTRIDATHWTITLTGKETTQIEYKYALGAWDFVEKDSACGEIANRTLTLSYGSNGIQMINDLVMNWRNVSPCGN